MINKGWKGESKRHSIAAKKNRKYKITIQFGEWMGRGTLKNYLERTFKSLKVFKVYPRNKITLIGSRDTLIRILDNFESGYREQAVKDFNEMAKPL